MIPRTKSNHERITEFWVRTSSLLFVAAIALACVHSIISFLVIFALSIIAGYRGWLSEHGDKDEAAPLKAHLEHYGLIWFTGLIGFIFILFAYPVTVYEYVKAKRSPYY